MLLPGFRGLERIDYLKPRLLVRQQTPLEHQTEGLLRGVAAPHRQQDTIVAGLLQQGRDKPLPPTTARQQGRELSRTRRYDCRSLMRIETDRRKIP